MCCERGKPCGRKASCGGSSCLSRIRSVVLDISVLFIISCPILALFRQPHCSSIPAFTQYMPIPSSSPTILPDPPSHPARVSHLESPYLGHASLTLEATSHSIVDTLWLPPRRVYAHKPVTLVAVEPGCLCLREYVRTFVLLCESCSANIVQLIVAISIH